MKIVHVNTYDIQGGAARGTYRLHKGLLESGQNSHVIVKYKHSLDPTVTCVSFTNTEEPSDIQKLYISAIQKSYINSNRTSISNTLFSFPYPGIDITSNEQIINADIINLHWITNFQSPLTLQKLFSLGKPVIWKFPDMWPFTGGCHYAAGCEKYKQDCVKCPQLIHDPYNLPGSILQEKLELFADYNLTIVTPSKWMADHVRQSKLFKNNRIEVIPNSLETDIFSPLSKLEAKRNIGANSEDFIILFGAHSCEEKRKGFAELLTSLQQCLENEKFYNLVLNNKIKLVCFGYLALEKLESIPIPLINIGYTESDKQLQEIYSSADIFVQTSLEENFGFTTLEAMSCGTPVIGFNVGVIPDVVEDDITGKIIPVGNTFKMAEAIVDCALSPYKCQMMGENSRKVIQEKYPLSVQASRYLELYQDLVTYEKDISMTLSNEHISSDKNIQKDTNVELVSNLPDNYVGSELSGIFEKLSPQEMFADYLKSEDIIQNLRQDLYKFQSQLQKTQSELNYYREQHQVIQETCDSLTQQLQDIVDNPIRWLLLAQSRSVEKPPLFKYPYEEGLVSVIIPAYNAEKFLSNAVISVWRQETTDNIHLELIVIDDGSTDETYNLANLLAEVSPIQMRVLTHPGKLNKGVAASRNLGIIESKGEWIAFLDADDAFLPNKTLTQVKWLRQNPEYLCACSYGYNVDSDGQPVIGWNSNEITGDYQTIDLQHRIPAPYTFDSLQNGCPVVNSTFITHRSVLLWSGLLPESIAHQAEDWILFTKISTKWSIPLISEPLIYYRIHPSSWTTKYFQENLGAGVKLEFLFAITHWLACRKEQEYQEIAQSFYRKKLPSYFSATGRLNDLMDAYIENQKKLNPNIESNALQLSSRSSLEEVLISLHQDSQLLQKAKRYKKLIKKIPASGLLYRFVKKIKVILTIHR
ncbi:glycosyltransferase [Nostoc sp. UHCC 0870]|uniref:glycosyltransferase n=1 Tax=Nostoc sp. UHCC 0870 TaxID=2914041 RepID=UPI001EDF8893|nr:glycosyltransferase [Nostoc sp. UHCC 0870]UKO98393.1 glycosyltransferase [Nostoc sp. UHCC 0870]